MLSLFQGRKKKTYQKTTEGTKLARYFTKHIPEHITGTLQPVYHGASLGFSILSLKACKHYLHLNGSYLFSQSH